MEAGCAMLWPRKATGNNMHCIYQELRRKDSNVFSIKTEQFWGDRYMHSDLNIIQHVHIYWVTTWCSYMHNFYALYVSVKISNLNVIDMNFPNTELIQHN